jgi:hypothetical protein
LRRNKSLLLLFFRKEELSCGVTAVACEQPNLRLDVSFSSFLLLRASLVLPQRTRNGVAGILGFGREGEQGTW